MLDDLEFTLRRGMTAGRVRALLGAPDDVVRVPGSRGVGWDYWLGDKSGFEVDCDILSLDFDPTRRLRSWSDWQD
jgi:hypothetical protein